MSTVRTNLTKTEQRSLLALAKRRHLSASQLVSILIRRELAEAREQAA